MALFVIALQGAVGGTADASCGDWLAHSNMPAAESGDEQQPVESPESQRAPSPCSQGQCRQAPDFPVPVGPQRSLTPQPDQWGDLADFALRLKSRKGLFDLDVSLNLPDGFWQPLERPPRL